MVQGGGDRLPSNLLYHRTYPFRSAGPAAGNADARPGVFLFRRQYAAFRRRVSACRPVPEAGVMAYVQQSPEAILGTWFEHEVASRAIRMGWHVLHSAEVGDGATMVFGPDRNKVVLPDLQLFRSEEHTSELQSLRHLVC